jgi:hypothetical protein
MVNLALLGAAPGTGRISFGEAPGLAREVTFGKRIYGSIRIVKILYVLTRLSTA